MKNLPGLYIHCPFCAGKCPYCDFYSVSFNPELADGFISAAIRQLESFRGVHVDSVYFGGGTPSLLGERRIAALMDAVRSILCVEPGSEITLELNPCTAAPGLMSGLSAAGINRLSIGAQSGIDSELKALGRRHCCAQTKAAADMARAAGITNISLDLMLAIPGQSSCSLSESIGFISECMPTHVSAYLLKLEPGTPFFERADSFNLPDDDGAADLYLQAVRELRERGFYQYEISNFARPGFEGRHNLKYWNGDPYIGIGPGAHGFTDGKRCRVPADIAGYIAAPKAVYDGPGGSCEEYAMLRLRLCEGLTEDGWRQRFGCGIPEHYRSRAAALPGALVECDSAGIRLTPPGFLVSNEIIARILS